MKTTLLIVQPWLTAYRLPVFAEMAAVVAVELASSPPPPGSAFGAVGIDGTAIRAHHLLPEQHLAGGRLVRQRGLLRLLLRRRPDRLLIAANPRYLSLWLALLLSRLLGIRSYAHGQALYDRGRSSRRSNALYWLMTRLASRYICYTPSGLESLRGLAPPERLAVAENSLAIEAELPPGQHRPEARGVLFIGRLREDSRLDLLIEAMRAARDRTGLDLQLHVIGGGTLPAPAPAWLQHHGELYEQARIRDIARDCRVGCYPGDAGLSVVHYMALGLVPVVHDRLDLHMGPEPSYVLDGRNGCRFPHADGAEGLARLLAGLFAEPARMRSLSEAAFAQYRQLSKPSLARRLLAAMDLDATTPASP